MEGKTVAMPTFSSSNALWPIVLQKNGVDASKIKVIKSDPATLAPMLAQGRVDATINWVTVGPAFGAVLKQAGKELGPALDAVRSGRLWLVRHGQRQDHQGAP